MKAKSNPQRAVRSKLFAVLTALALIVAACGSGSSTEAGGDDGPSGDDPVTISILTNDGPTDAALIDVLTTRYNELNPNVTFDVETFPNADADNVVKTKLATGEMNDVFLYNSGSLLQALNPDRTIEPLTGDAALDNVSDGYLPAVTYEGEVYGVPNGPGFAGGILYNRTVYADLGLEVPTTWAEFAANNEVIKAAGIAPVLATYADSWTAQLFILADFYNVQAQDPGFAESYTNNEAKFATNDAAVVGFERLAEGADKGWYQEDYLSTSHSDGLGMLARGEVAHYPMLSVVVPSMDADNPGTSENIGFFAQPSDSADVNGATLWLPNSLYIAQDSEVKGAAKEFLRWVTSVEGAEYVNSQIPPTGPIVLNGVTLPDEVPEYVKEIQAYIDAGNASPALEFISPVKGPSLPNISVEVGSGIRSAAAGAATYDDDVEKQAKQLGLEGW